MKTRRIGAAILVFLLCLAFACTAFAAKSVKAPTLRFQGITKRGIESGHSKDIGVNASDPGFLTLWLTDAEDETIVYRHYYDGIEIHSGVNYFSINAFDDNGYALAEGKYRLHATMVNQYDVETKNEASAKLNILAAEDLPVPTSQIAQQAAAQQAYTAPTDPSGQSYAYPSDQSYTYPSAQQGAYTAPQSAPAADSLLSYSTSANFTVGQEGYQIGVGVGDRAADDGSYWSLTRESTDAEIWAAITRPLMSVDVDEKESSYIYDSPDEGRKQIGTVSGLSQGLHVIANREDGWSLVEAYRNDDSAFVRGYIKTSRLKSVDVNTTYGIVIDKAAQTLTVYKEGQRIGSCAVSTGLPTTKYLSRETPAGEFMLVTRRGTLEYYNSGIWCRYGIRVNGNYHLSEIPTTRKNGSDFSPMVNQLGTKSTRGNILIAHDPSTDGGINAEWIWNMSDKNRKVKVLILDDKDRTSIPAGE